MLAARPLAIVTLLVLATPAVAQEVCDVPPATGPVSIIILQSSHKVHELAASTARGASVVARDANTVVFSDGRVITSDVAAATGHLNRLGWGTRHIDVVASFPPRRAVPRGRRKG